MSGAREHWEDGLGSGTPLSLISRNPDSEEATACSLDAAEEAVAPEVVLAPLALDTVLTPENLRRLIKIVSHSKRGLL
ncbi:MAG: hypothetical protein HQL86_04380 [Magnetococcales bacterium]|nr:hypothetical protein [Magnetococcales bacterium]